MTESEAMVSVPAQKRETIRERDKYTRTVY